MHNSALPMSSSLDTLTYKENLPIPSFCFAHGSPALLKEAGNFFSMPGFTGAHDGSQASFLREFGPFLLKTYKPKAIVVFSAHWETGLGRKIQIMDNDTEWNDLYYDYYGFPDEMYKLKFEAIGDPNLSSRIKQLLDKAKIPSEIIKNQRGFDHGCFVPFKLMFGDSCPIPIIEVAQYADMQKNLDLGQSLAPLRNEGVLILSGGLTVHNLIDRSSFSETMAQEGLIDFHKTVSDACMVQEGTFRNEAIRETTRHPWFKQAHPTIEHFTPIAIAAGAGLEGGSCVVSDIYGALTVAFGV